MSLSRGLGCIESGDDLDPDLSWSAFGRMAGVGGGGRLTGAFFILFFIACQGSSLAVRKKIFLHEKSIFDYEKMV